MLGYSVMGQRAIRVDVLEKFAAIVRKLARGGPFAATPDMLRLAGGDATVLGPIMRDLGYVMKETAEGPSYQRKPRRSRQPKRGPKSGKDRVQKNGVPKSGAPKAQMDPHSPFAKLRELALVK